MALSKHSVILFKYIIISVLIMLVCIAIISNMVRISVMESSEWQQKADSLKTSNIRMRALRGNVLSCNDEILASTIPEFNLFIDFRVEGLEKDTLEKYVKPLSAALASKLGERSAADYEKAIREGYKKKTGRFKICRQKVSYLDYLEIKRFPLFCKGENKSGFFIEKRIIRMKPFGPVASRTIGRLADTGGVYGIEQAYNLQLKGKDGLADKEKVRNTWVYRDKIKSAPGMDVRTTLDLRIQSTAEQALLGKLREIDAEAGTVVVMEVATGKVKAIANYSRKAEGVYEESRNNAVADMVEPGSTFKTVSMMIALDDGIVTPDETFDVGNGVFMYGRARMTDHNYTHGGYGVITAAQAIQFSSNIGTAKAVLKGYERRPSAFVDHLRRMGICDSVDFKMQGQGYPRVPHPKTSRGWNNTTLPWMSFGYNVQIPPIYTLMFYNAIANGGKMISPIFVTDVLSDGKAVEHYTTSVIRDSICKTKTLYQIRQMLSDVVELGTAKMLKSPYVKIAGKTGTAQISQGAAGYKGSKTQHRVSFCGYFPDNERPKYSCIVVITNPRIGYPSGGGMSGMVLKKIAEQIYAQGYFGEPMIPERDSVNLFYPKVKSGLANAIKAACDSFGVPYELPEENRVEWVTASQGEKGVELTPAAKNTKTVPPVTGMGLKDALLLLDRAGMKTKVNGRGIVYEQIPAAGSVITNGETAILNLH